MGPYHAAAAPLPPLNANPGATCEAYAVCCCQVTVSYSDQFRLTFGCSGQATAANCHTAATVYLEKDLNQTGSLVHLAKVGECLASFEFSSVHTKP